MADLADTSKHAKSSPHSLALAYAYRKVLEAKGIIVPVLRKKKDENKP